MPDTRRARDLQLLDAIDALEREALQTDVWRLVRESRDPVLGSPSRSRWCNGNFDVLYTALERDGAVAEIYALLSEQPVFPSRGRWFVTRLRIAELGFLKLPDLPALSKLGVDPARYAERIYARTQDIADAAYFLGFVGLVVPSARWPCHNVVLFTDRVTPEQVEIRESEQEPVDWAKWRKSTRR